MDMRWLLLTLFLIACAAICWAEESSEDKDGDQDLLADDMRAINDEDDKRVFRYGRSPGVFRYGKRGHGVFRYGKRGPGVFRYGKRADLDDDDSATKRIFRWGKRDDVRMDEAAKRLLRWGKRFDDDDVSNLYDADDYDDDVKRMIFRYGKRDDVIDKRRLFSFGKRNNGNHVISEVDLRSDSPHVPFRFGEK